MALDAVHLEPVSAGISLLIGKITANFHFPAWFRGLPHCVKAYFAGSYDAKERFGCEMEQGNKFSYQGMFSAEQGFITRYQRRRLRTDQCRPGRLFANLCHEKT